MPFFISTFPPEKQIEADKLIKILKQRLQQNGTKVTLINLFELCIKLLEQDGVLEEYLKLEQTKHKTEFQQILNAELDVETKLAPVISMYLEGDETLLFITGVGAVYPVVRTHTILTNLQSLRREQPTLLFFPGKYNHKNGAGSALDLFGKLNEDRYYRAFNLNQYQIG